MKRRIVVLLPVLINMKAEYVPNIVVYSNWNTGIEVNISATEDTELHDIKIASFNCSDSEPKCWNSLNAFRVHFSTGIMWCKCASPK